MPWQILLKFKKEKKLNIFLKVIITAASGSVGESNMCDVDSVLQINHPPRSELSSGLSMDTIVMVRTKISIISSERIKYSLD